MERYEFIMPDGTILTDCEEVDKYYKLAKCSTYLRLENGWSEQECANNKKDGVGRREYVFNMPDGTVLTKCPDVDRYYGLCRGATSVRIRTGWLEEECANNRKLRNKYGEITRFNMPDGTVLYDTLDVDNYHNLKNLTTQFRLTTRGWTVEECANNRKEDGSDEWEYTRGYSRECN